MKRTLFIIVTLLAGLSSISAQNTLFTYPVYPGGESDDLETRCNWLAQNFWSNYDLSKPITEAQDTLFIRAMNDWMEMMFNANLTVVTSSIRDFMFKAQSNQANFLKIGRMAEILLYDRQVNVIDDVYLTFAQSIADASWVKKEIKERYKMQIDRINAGKLGGPISDFNIVDDLGNKKKFFDIPLDSAKLVLVFFTAPGGKESDIARLRLSTDINANKYIDMGLVKVINVVCADKVSVAADATQYPNWTVVSSADAARILDVRFVPSFFLLDENRVIESKNNNIDYIKAILNN